MKQTEQEMKIPTVDNFWGFLIRQLPVVVFMSIAIWLLWGKLERLETQVTNCNQTTIEILKTQLDASQAALSRNSDIMLKTSEATVNFSNSLNQKTRRAP